MKIRHLIPLLLGLMLALAACAPQPTPAPAPTEEPAPAAPTAAPTMAPEPTEAMPAESMDVEVKVSNHADLGSYLVDANGMTLYLFTKDSPNTSSCSGGCLQAWPALTGTPVAGEGLDAALLGSFDRGDGTIQVTYNGWPLYYYAADAKAGDAVGQGSSGVWFAVAPDGTAIEAAISEEDYSY